MNAIWGGGTFFGLKIFIFDFFCPNLFFSGRHAQTGSFELLIIKIG